MDQSIDINKLNPDQIDLDAIDLDALSETQLEVLERLALERLQRPREPRSAVVYRQHDGDGGGRHAPQATGPRPCDLRARLREGRADRGLRSLPHGAPRGSNRMARMQTARPPKTREDYLALPDDVRAELGVRYPTEG